MSVHPPLTMPPICGNTGLTEAVEVRFREIRAEKGESQDGGCGRSLPWLHAYRCLECGRWMHAECLRQHFVEHGDRAAEAQQRADSAEQAWRDLNKRAEGWLAESELARAVVAAARAMLKPMDATIARLALNDLSAAVEAYQRGEVG